MQKALLATRTLNQVSGIALSPNVLLGFVNDKYPDEVIEFLQAVVNQLESSEVIIDSQTGYTLHTHLYDYRFVDVVYHRGNNVYIDDNGESIWMW